MIESLEALSNVGLLREAIPGAPVGFGKVTSLYGENGRGKSTFAMLLRAFGEGDSTSVADRANWHSGQKPLVKIKRTSGVDVFANGTWRGKPGPIAVFDMRFVEENVHSGWNLQPDHRQRLYSFVLGTEAAALEAAYKATDAAERLANADLKVLDAELAGHRGSMQISEFVKMPAAPDIEERIDKSERKLQQAKDSDLIQKRGVPEPLVWSIPDLSKFWTVLAKSYASVGDDAEARVKEHVKSIPGSGVEQWLSDGQAYAEGGDCPFCGEPLERSSLLPLYRQYFDEEYRKLKAEAVGLSLAVAHSLPATLEVSVASAAKANIDRADAWRGVLALAAPVFKKEEYSAAVQEARDILTSLAISKAATPLESREVAAARAKIEAALAAAEGIVLEYNVATEAEKQKANEYKKALAGVAAKDVEAELANLRRERTRHTKPVEDLIVRYLAAKALAKSKTDAKVAALQDLNDHAIKVFRDYHAEINAILAAFGTNYTIKTCKDDHKGGTKRVEYELDFGGVSVGFVGGDRVAPGKTFADALSEGDRRTLALAFFLARIRLAPDLSDTIVVLDDPMCSLGATRRKATVRLLTEVSGKCKQLVLLCHDAYFLRECSQRLSESHYGGNRPTELQFDVAADGSSVIVPCDFEALCASPYYLDYSLVRNYVESGGTGDHAAVHSATRRVAEGYLRRRWVGRFEKCDGLGAMLGVVRSVPGASEFASLTPLLKDLSDLNEFSRDPHHGAGENAPRTVLSPTEVHTHAKTLMKVIYA